MNLSIRLADYSQHGVDIVNLLNNYALDPMGGGEALSAFTQTHLIEELSKLPHAFTIIAYVDNEAVGLINCFEAFSTFSCKPLINIHDVTVKKEFRGLNIAQKMLKKVEEIAVEKGCCKLTLEILSNNNRALNAYKKFGFSSYELDPAAGSAVFWQKIL